MIGEIIVAAAAVLGSALVWIRVVQPLQERVRAERRQSAALVDFSTRLLVSHKLPSTPQQMKDIMRQAADSLVERIPDGCIAVWYREHGQTEMIHRTGPLTVLDPSLLSVYEDYWSDVFEDQRKRMTMQLIITPGHDWHPLWPALANQGMKTVRLMAWGLPDRPHGLFMVCDPRPTRTSPDLAYPEIDVLAAYFSSLADMAASLWALAKTSRRLEGEISALHQVASTITSHPDKPTEILGAIAAIVARMMEADLCAFLLYDEQVGELVTQPGAYGLGGDEGQLYRMPLTNDKSSSVRVFLTGVPFLSGDAQDDPQVISDYAKRWQCRSLVCVPLSLEDRRVGVIRLGSFKKDFFNQDHVHLLELIAEEAVVLVESVKLNRKLSEANQRLSEINRIKDDFVSMVSHEFKTPLTSIKGFISLILERESGPLTESQAKFLTIALSATERLSMLVSDLLDLSRLESGVRMEFSPISIIDLLEQARLDHELQSQNRSIQLRLALPARLPQVRGDAKWLRQVVDNLVSNALKFTPPGGMVILSASDKGEMVSVTVEDTGVGITPDDQSRIFEKFYRARNRGATNAPGTGLGLAIAKFIIDKHDGRIWVESEVGKGSRFHFVLPVAKKEEIPAPRLEQSEPA